MEKFENLPKPSSLQIQLKNGADRRFFCMEFSEKDTIGSIKQRLSQRSGIDSTIMKVIFCGRQLTESTNLYSLFLGPQTSLTVIIEHKQTISPIALTSSAQNLENTCNKSEESPVYISFYVFCKKCNKLERGKLRAYCNNCNSMSIIFKKEPKGWCDVLERSKLKVDCNECETEQNAQILFKCVNCKEVSIPLTDVKQNTTRNKCVICREVNLLNVIMNNCKDSTCVECFIAYAEQSLAQMNLVWKSQVGYTISCPMFGCSSYLTDVHHLYLLGNVAYQRYQRLTAQMFFAQQIERQYCPYLACNAAFILEEIVKEEKIILCPECLKLFCRFCKAQGDCKCEQELKKDLNEILIEKITKLCPNCSSPTERDGGCAHIYCTQCQTEWCFLCQKIWANSCQSDHWFD